MPNIDKQAALMRERGYIYSSEAARLLGVAPRTIWHHLDEGHVPFIRVGQTRYMKINDLIAWFGRESPESAAEVAALLMRESPGVTALVVQSDDEQLGYNATPRRTTRRK